MHPSFFDWFPNMKEKKEKIVMSDYFLRRSNFPAIVERIHEEKIKNIVIIGGSHSGFSSAWTLLNGPADILHNTHVKPSV